MIDFSQVASIQRYKLTMHYAQRFFKYLDYQGTGMKNPVCLWKRPLSYPVMGFFISYRTADPNPLLFPDGTLYQECSWEIMLSHKLVYGYCTTST